MAGNAITNTFMSYDAKGLREDLTDVIWNVSPTETPFVTSIAKAKATNTLHEWQTDALAAFDVTNAQVQGDDITSYQQTTPTARLGNRTQISRKTLIISGTEEVALKAGRKSEMAYQVAKRGRELRRDIEGICLNRQAAVAAASGTAPTLAGVSAWIKTSSSRGTSGTNPTGDGTDLPTDGTQRAVTEAMLKTVLAGIFTASGEQPDIMLTPPGQKGTVSAFTGNATRFMEATAEKIVAGVNLYSGDFGEVKIVPDRFMRAREIFVLNSDYWALAWYRPIQMADLAKTGDAEKKMLIAEYTLEARNEASSGVIADLT
ncbi:MAG TPA: DUF5309 domain-containing protein [Stellaceae bacterium]|jgi:hypothetical protein|nr:DUF5309 domain-containing protein [Stellaceae bacterium]